MVDNEWLIGEHMGLDQREYFIIVPIYVWQRRIESPSQQSPPLLIAGRFPHGDALRHVAMQYRLVTEKWHRVRSGSSPVVEGAMQALHWAADIRKMVETHSAFCGRACAAAQFGYRKGLRLHAVGPGNSRTGFRCTADAWNARCRRGCLPDGGFSQAGFASNGSDMEAGGGLLRATSLRSSGRDFLKEGARNKYVR